MLLVVTAYKIYASILNERMKKEIERKLVEGQFGFRAERSHRCHICSELYELYENYINKESKKRGKLFVS